jgi:hypothetical protein
VSTVSFARGLGLVGNKPLSDGQQPKEHGCYVRRLCGVLTNVKLDPYSLYFSLPRERRPWD